MKREQECGGTKIGFGNGNAVFLPSQTLVMFSDSDSDSDGDLDDDECDEGYRITPSDSFYQIQKSLRRLLEQFHHTETIKEIDCHLMRLYVTAELTSLEMTFTDSYQRKLAHGAAKYYCLNSSSKDTAEVRCPIPAYCSC